MNLLRVQVFCFIKGFWAIFFVFLYFIVGLLNQILFFLSPFLRKKIAQENTRWTCFLVKSVMGYQGIYRVSSQQQGSLLVCNHISYMDILAIASKIPCLFVTSLDIKRIPFLGWITSLGECLYINRKTPANIDKELENICYWMSRGFNVLIFPEATTGDGVNMKKFHSSLLKVGDNAKIPILSYVIKYTQINNQKTSSEDKRDLIAWTAGTPFVPHFVQQLKFKSVTFELTELGQTSGGNFQNRKILTEYLETQISKAFYSSHSS